VDEDVFAAVIRLHEAITTTTIETDDSTGRSHWITSLVGVVRAYAEHPADAGERKRGNKGDATLHWCD